MTTRRRIHGIKWPSTNPKYLVADFLSPSDVARISKGQFVIQEEDDSVISENNAAGVCVCMCVCVVSKLGCVTFIHVTP